MLLSRVRRGAVAIGWSAAFLLLSLLLTTLLAFGAAYLITGSAEGVREWARASPADSLLVQGIASLLASLAATWAIGVRANRLDRDALRYQGGRRGVAGFGAGLLVGGSAAIAALLLAVALTDAGWIRDVGGWEAYAGATGRTLAVLAPAAAAEEVLFRGVPLVLLAAVVGRGAAIVALAVLFGVAHVGNPGATPLALANIAGAGVFLGLAFYAPGGILTAFGAHLGWNGALAALDAPVSGLPFRIPMIDYEAGGPAWVTGGGFGPEGGLAATATIALACLVTVRWTRKDVAA